MVSKLIILGSAAKRFSFPQANTEEGGRAKASCLKIRKKVVSKKYD